MALSLNPKMGIAANPPATLRVAMRAGERKDRKEKESSPRL